MLDHRAGTPFYIAPEVMHQGTSSKRADVFSFGVILWELYNQELVHHNLRRFASQTSPTASSFGSRRDVKAPSFDSNTPLAYALVTGACLSPNPIHRPNFDELVAILHELRSAALRGALDPGRQHRDLSIKLAP